MTFTHALSTNNYGPAKFIVATSAANGTHTTLASALTSASSGDTIILRDSVTENVTLKAGVNIVAWQGSQSTPEVSITGKCTMTTAGTVTISGIRLTTNSDFFLAVTGSAASVVNLEDCYLNASNNTGISYTSSDANSQVTIWRCTGDIGTTGIGLFASSSAGLLRMEYSRITNSGATTTASTASAGTLQVMRSSILSPITTSGTATFNSHFSTISGGAQNATALTIGGSGSNTLRYGLIEGGTASAMSISSSISVSTTTFGSSNTNSVTGAGTLTYSSLSFIGSSSGMNVTTQSALVTRSGITRSAHQPAFIATLGSADSNVTGAGTSYTLGSGNALTEIADQDGDFVTSGTFTAPYTGIYWLQFRISNNQVTAAMTRSAYSINTSNRTYQCIVNNPGAVMSGDTSIIGQDMSCLADMDAGDTATFSMTFFNGAGDTADVQATLTTTERTYCSGFLVC